MYTHRACMAHIDNPIFCPSHTSPLAFAGAHLHTTTISHNHDTRTHEQYDDNEDEDDEETGGVPLATQDPAMMNENDSAITTTHDVHITSPPTHERSGLSIGEVSDGVTNRAHPRPEARDPREEEEARRVRLALEGEPLQERPQFDMLAAIAHGFEHQRSQDNNPYGSGLFTPAHSAFTPQLPADLQARLQDILPLARAVYPAQHIRFADEMQIDDDALSVDDPRRNYDFADFMDLWRLRWKRDKRLPHFEPGLQSSVRLGRPVESLSRSSLISGKADIQGIRWDLIGPTKSDAMVARNILHPSRCNRSSNPRQHISSEEEYQYQFRSFMPLHKAKFNHYQLRNVMAASGRNEIFYSTGGQVQRASLACPNQRQTILDLTKLSNSAADFRITCLAASRTKSIFNQSSDNVLIAGGFYGEFAVSNLDSADASTSEGFVTYAYNGLVTHVHTFADRQSNLTRAAFCSNDRKVQLLDIRSMQFTKRFSYDNAINCSATSPDGRLRVLAGDTRVILITDAERGHPLITLKEHNDHCFACDWSPDGRYVAAAGQDGKTVVWDARYWKTPWSIMDCVTSCPRSLNFTNNGALVVAENDDAVSIYEGPLYQRRQDLRFFGSIAGVTLLDGGAEIAIANADKTVGGLLSFERSSLGLGNGSYGRRIESAGSRWRGKTAVLSSNWICDTLVQ